MSCPSVSTAFAIILFTSYVRSGGDGMTGGIAAELDGGLAGLEGGPEEELDGGLAGLEGGLGRGLDGGLAAGLAGDLEGGLQELEGGGRGDTSSENFAMRAARCLATRRAFSSFTLAACTYIQCVCLLYKRTKNTHWIQPSPAASM